MTKPELEAYVKTLPVELQAVFTKMYYFVRDAADTGGDDFQIAAEVVEVFTKYAERREQWRRQEG